MGQDRNSWWMLTLVYPALSGLIMAAAFPPLPLGFLACLSLLPLVGSAKNLSGRGAFGAGFVQGLVFYGATLYWIAWITPPGMAGAIFYMSLFRGLFVWVWSFILRRSQLLGLWLAPFLWVGFEYFNTLSDMGFSWVLLGHSQADYLPLIQFAEATGVYGVSFWVVLVNVVVLMVWQGEHRKKWMGVLVVCFALPLGFGLWRLAEPVPEGDFSVALVQQNIPPTEKSHWGFDHNFNHIKPLTIQAKETGAKLVVWSEAALPAYFKSSVHRTYQARTQALVDSLGIHLYMGANRYEEDPGRDRRYNSSFLFEPGGGDLPHYDKVKVVPFGERAPFPELLSILREIRWSGAGYVSGDFESGVARTVFEVPGGKFSGMICFDSVFPWLARELTVEGAEFLVVITNDGWFGRTSGPYQHAKMSVFRAIENRRSVIRCANTGISMFIDPYGRRLQETGIYHEAVLQQNVVRRTDLSIYARFGDLFSQLCLVMVFMGISVVAIRRPEVDESSEDVTKPQVPEGTVASIGIAHEEGLVGEEGKPMPFLDHLEELRWHILKALAAIIVGAIFCGIFVDQILFLLTRPVRVMEFPPVLQTLKPMGMFVVKLEIALVGGGILALPILIYQLWLFIAPGLFSRERHFATFVIGSSTVCFGFGAFLAYWVVIPMAMTFFVGMTADTGVAAQFDIGLYISFVIRLLLAFGLVFELPVLTFFLAKIGLATSERLRKGRRYAIIVGFILAAILTPPDPISQLLMALPLVVLYEVSIWVARLVNE
ncbi:MAG: apolipoprotein N-acyltransferase [Candidatus Latescibacteria bacterium]|jgi:apolipoprotein N-acyltransferase|nr:apolipoprotein N-acyltransferase [Candidatus Latescibacterota bacterium]